MRDVDDDSLDPDLGLLRPTRAEIDLDRLTANYEAIARRVAPAGVMAVLKANAYGHGLVPVARHLEQLDVPYLAVAYVEEGIQLRRAGIQSPILVFGGFPEAQIPLFLQNDLTMTASSVEKLQQIERTAAALGVRARVHLKLDTGMGRVGVQYFNAATLFEASLTCARCEIEGVYSHFADADGVDLSGAEEQYRRFCQALSFYERPDVPRPPLRHIANSGAILQMPRTYLDMVRVGILLYGVYPAVETRRTIAVEPALSWRSRVVYFKVQPANHPVSYGSTWSSPTPTRVVTVPVGYGDGYFRALSNRGEVIIHGRRYPIVGRVCMDQFMVDIGQDSAYNGDDVILIGRAAGGEEITFEEFAAWAGTIPYEVLTNINSRVPRTYFHGRAGSLEAGKNK